MSEYRRFISYIYRYEKGRKENNCGFVKAEIRGNVCRLQMHLDRSGRAENPLKVYGFVREGEYLLGLYLGTAAAKGTACDFQVSTAAQRFADSAYAAQQIRGIWLRQEEGENYITIWDDEPVEVQRFVTELPRQENAENLRQESTEDLPQESVRNLQTDDTAGSEAERAERTSDIREAAVYAEENSSQTDTIQKRMERAVYSQRGKTAKKKQYQMSAAAVPSLAGRWENFRYHYPVLEVFADEELTECLRIMPKDLSYLGSAQWEYARSPFVQQAAAKYHHLMIGRHENGRFVLGVPGIYGDMQNRQLARMYGFPMFKAAKQEREQAAADSGAEEQFTDMQINMEETFGYWYRFLD